MKPGMLDRRQREGWIRLGFGFLLNIPLYFVCLDLTKFSAFEKEIRDNFIGACLAAVIWVTVIPVFWRGTPWQAPIAFLLIFFQPGFVLYSIISMAITYW